MKQIITLFVALTIMAACSSNQENPQTEKAKITYDFRTYNWGDAMDKIIDSEAPKQAKVIENEVIELEFEDTFLGVSTDLEKNNVARMACFFVENQLKGGWYYIYTDKANFDMTKQVSELKTELGVPSTESFDQEQNANNYLWLKDKTAIKLFARDAEDKFRFELYYYERQWFDANMKTE